DCLLKREDNLMSWITLQTTSGPEVAKGDGLSLPMDQFDVTLAPGEPAALLETRWDKSEAQLWSLRAIDVDPDYAASIAVEGADWILKCWQASEAMLLKTLKE